MKKFSDRGRLDGRHPGGGAGARGRVGFRAGGRAGLGAVRRGGRHDFVAPADVHCIEVDAIGGQGGRGGDAEAVGGLGGQVVTILTVSSPGSRCR